MRCSEAERSGVLPIVRSDDAPTIDHGCHQIIDAAAALRTNVELLAEMARDPADSAPVVADLRASVDRIVSVARALRGRPTAGASRRTTSRPGSRAGR